MEKNNINIVTNNDFIYYNLHFIIDCKNLKIVSDMTMWNLKKYINLMR